MKKLLLVLFLLIATVQSFPQLKPGDVDPITSFQPGLIIPVMVDSINAYGDTLKVWRKLEWGDLLRYDSTGEWITLDSLGVEIGSNAEPLSLKGRIYESEATINVHSNLLDSLQSQILLKANSTITDSLRQRVLNAESTIDVHSSTLGGLQAGLLLKANTNTTDSLRKRVYDAETMLSMHSTNIGGLQSAMNLKASVVSVDSLKNRFDTTAVGIDLLATDIEGLQSGIYLYAKKDSLTSSINLTPDGAKILASKLDIYGTIKAFNGSNDSTVIDGGKIKATSIEATKLKVDSLNSITANLGTITAGHIDASIIKSGMIGANRIAAGTITGTHIAANTIMGRHINVDSLNALNIIADSVKVGSYLSSPVITGGELVGTSIKTTAGYGVNQGGVLISGTSIQVGNYFVGDHTFASAYLSLSSTGTLSSSKMLDSDTRINAPAYLVNQTPLNFSHLASHPTTLAGYGITDGASGTGTVTSVGLSVPTGLTVTSGSPVTTSGTIAVGLQAGYSIPTTANQSNWTTAYNWGNHASGGYLTNVTSGGLPLSVSTAGSTKTISITQASSSGSGYLSSTDWNTFNNKVSFPGFGTSAGVSAEGNHAHTGVYQPVGNYITGISVNAPLTMSGSGGGVTIGASVGSTANTLCAGNDSRLSDSRTPLAHNQAWSTITSKPTTISGFGITDCSIAGSNSPVTLYVSSTNGGAATTPIYVRAISVGGVTIYALHTN